MLISTIFGLKVIYENGYCVVKRKGYFSQILIAYYSY